MNLKLAKTLRRMAKDALATIEEKAEVGTYLKHNKTGVVINARNSLRGVYRRIKREPRVRIIAYQINAEQRQLRSVQKLSEERGLQ
jgi:hypothetical protein